MDSIAIVINIFFLLPMLNIPGLNLLLKDLHSMILI